MLWALVAITVTALLSLPATVFVLVRGFGGAQARALEAEGRMLEHLKEASPLGGLPRQLWLEEHELKKRQMALLERKADLEEPLIRARIEERMGPGSKRRATGATLRDPSS